MLKLRAFDHVKKRWRWLNVDDIGDGADGADGADGVDGTDGVDGIDSFHLSIRVAISSAAFLNCHDVPIEILPTLGLGRVYVIDRIEAIVNPDSIGYTFSASLWLVLGDINESPQLYEPFFMKTVLQGVHENVEYSSELGPSAVYQDMEEIASFPMVLTAQVTDPTNGEADFDLIVHYHIIAI